MSRLLLSLSIITLCAITLPRCGSVDGGEIVANQFFDHLIKQNYDEAKAMCIPALLKDPSLDDFLVEVATDDTWGNLTSAKKGMGFNSNYNNGISTVSLPYILTYADGTTANLEITLIETDGGYKVSSLYFQ